MQTLKVVEEIKHLAVRERGALIREKDALQKRYHDGINFFLSEKRRTKEDIEKADKTMREICSRLDKLTQQIYDLDIIIGVKLETLLNDSNIKITIAQRTDDSGDKLPEQSFSLSDFNEEKLTITTDDLYALKILKPALNYRNVEILRKEDT